jgi:hypothetical protein
MGVIYFLGVPIGATWLPLMSHMITNGCYFCACCCLVRLFGQSPRCEVVQVPIDCTTLYRFIHTKEIFDPWLSS